MIYTPAGLVYRKGWTKGCSMSHKCRGLWRTGEYCFGNQWERSPILKRFYWLVLISERFYWFSFISERFYWLVLNLTHAGIRIQTLAAPSSPTKRAEFRRIRVTHCPTSSLCQWLAPSACVTLFRKKQRRWVIRFARVKMCAWRIQKPGLQTCSLTKLSIRRLRKAQERKARELEFSIIIFGVTGLYLSVCWYWLI